MNYYEASFKVMSALDLDATLDCGQTFRWRKINGVWQGVVEDNVLFLEYNKENGYLKISSNKEEFRGMPLKEGIEDYLGLKDSLETIRGSINNSLISSGYSDFRPKMNEIYQASYGLRLLRQDAFEMCMDYIISTQMNINMIKVKIERICSLFSENRINFKGYTFFGFPTLEQLKSLPAAKFREAGLGYRSEWLQEFFMNVDCRKLKELKNCGIKEKLDYFLRFKGIGYKVANCIILFGYSDFSAFPVDVWISRFMESNFNITGNPQSLFEKGRKIFGDYCGYAQEYFFNYSRNLSRPEV